MTCTTPPEYTLVFPYDGRQVTYGCGSPGVIPTLTPKAPFDIIDLVFDFTNVIPAGDMISVVDSVTYTGNDTALTLSGTNNIIAGYTGVNTAVIVENTGAGSLGTWYCISVQVTTMNGKQFQRSAYLPVENL